MAMIRWSCGSGQPGFRVGMVAARGGSVVADRDPRLDARARWLAVVRRIADRMGVCGTGAWIGAGPFAGVVYA